MNRPLRITTFLVVSAALTGCATKAQLRRGLAAQDSALAVERNERMAADQQITQQHSADMAGLRSQLDSLTTTFNTRITELEDGLQFDVPVHFAFNDAELGQDAAPVLDRFAQVVQRYYTGSLISVEGFADPAGPASYNRRLSMRRAESVKSYLVSKGIPAEQLRTVGYGETRLVTPRASAGAPGAELNRRVAFVVETPPNAGMGNGMMSQPPTNDATPADTTSQ